MNLSVQPLQCLMILAVSGLRLNDKKTEALWIGASIGNDKILLPGKELKWPKDGKVPWDMDFNRSRTICLFKLL